jgi:hypothetical protein
MSASKGQGFQPRDTSKHQPWMKKKSGTGSATSGSAASGSAAVLSMQVAASMVPSGSAEQADAASMVPSGSAAQAAEPMQEEEDFDAIAASMVPDYGFPIVYYFITHAELANPRLKFLNTYINIQTNDCNRTPGESSEPAFLRASNETCVLFMYWEATHHLEVLKTANMDAFYSCLSDLTFLNKRILGHAKILKTNHYLAIYNFCKHSKLIASNTLTPTPRTTQFGSIGIAMFNALLTATTFLQTPAIDAAAGVLVDAAGGGAAGVVNVAAGGAAAGEESHILWLGIDVRNPDFAKVARIYTVCGFSDPIITNRDVTGALLPITILQLTRPLYAHASSHLDSINNYNQAMNLMHKWDASINPPPQDDDVWDGIATREITNLAGVKARIMKYKFSFDRSCILSLHLFPFVSFNQDKLATGVSQMQGQRETSGKFVVTRSLYDQTNPSTGHDVLALETTVVSPSVIRINFNIGTVDSVPMDLAESTFHTHPIANYTKYKTIIGPPSSGDFLVFVQSFVSLQLSVDQSFKFSLVSTIEGVHIISLTPKGIIFFINLMHQSHREAAAEMPPVEVFTLFTSKVNAITQNYEYEFPERKFVWEEHGIDEARSQEALLEAINKYKDWFNRVNEENGNFFRWEWISWDEFNVDDLAEVYYLENRIRLAP